MPPVMIDEAAIEKACAAAIPSKGDEGLLTSLKSAAPDLDLTLGLARDGWMRVGGVVDSEGGRVAEHLREWAEEETGGDMEELVANFGLSDYRTTRINGRSIYLIAPLGKNPMDFVQIEVEETQEVIERELFPEDWLPDDVEDLIDPLEEVPHLEPTPVTKARYSLRRVTDFRDSYDEFEESAMGDRLFRRFVRDWTHSSSGHESQFCDHWVLTLVPYTDRFGEHRFDVKPRPAASVGEPKITVEEVTRGTELGKLLHQFDRDAGYPMAWFFLSLTGNGVPHQVLEAVNEDLAGAFAYLPAKDVKVLREWVEQPYSL